MLSGGHSSKKPGAPYQFELFPDISLISPRRPRARRKPNGCFTKVATAPSTLMRGRFSAGSSIRTDRVLQLVEGFMPECAWARR